MKKITTIFIVFALIFTIIPASAEAAKTYRVKSGDTLWNIAHSFGVPVKIITNQNNISNPQDLDVGEKLIISRESDMITITIGNNSNQNNYKTYRIKPGDTLWKLAQKFDTSMSKLVELNNNLDQSYTIYVGQEINVPTKNNESNNDRNNDNNEKNNRNNDNDNQKEYVYYTVQPGDILWNIAQKYNTTVGKLVKMNNIKDAYDLYAGKKIKVKEKDTDNKVNPGSTKRDYMPYYFYNVKENDKVWKIADRFGIRVSELLRANKIQDINKINKDQTLVIPMNKSNKFSYIRNMNKKINNYYRVKNNETINEIANYFNISKKAIRYINQISSEESIKQGQLLLMPINPAFFKEHKIYRVKENNLPAHELAYRNSLSIRDMLRANYMKDVNTKFKKGTVLLLPLDKDSKATWVDYKNGEPVNNSLIN